MQKSAAEKSALKGTMAPSSAGTKMTHCASPALGRTRLCVNGLLPDVIQVLGSKPTACSQTEINIGPQASEQESGVPLAEPLNFLGRESVASEPDFQDGIIPFQGLQEGFCPKVGDAVVGQL